MYRVIGADQKEYGPVSAEQMRQWIAESRVNAQTKVQTEGSDEWKLLADVPEFAEKLKGHAPPAPTTAPAPAARTSRLAIASLVLGICGLVSCGITSLVGLILGLVALVKINKSRGQQSGQGLAIAGIVVSGVFLLMIPIWAGMLLPALAKAKMKAQSINCVNNAKQLALGIMMYADDNNGQFPAPATWCDAIQKYLGSGKAFQCVSGDASKRCHYAFNAKLDGLETKKITNPANTVLVFEIEGGWNVSGGPELLPAKPRHGRIVVVGFADGHVEQVTEARPKELRWEP